MRLPGKGAGFAMVTPFRVTPERIEMSISFTCTSAPTVALARSSTAFLNSGVLSERTR